MTHSGYLSVSVGLADFNTLNATDDALVDILLMIMTYDPEKGCGN